MRHARVHEHHRHLVERCVDLLAGRHEVARGDDLLPFGTRSRSRRRARRRGGVAHGARRRRRSGARWRCRSSNQSIGAPCSLSCSRLVVVDRQRQRHLARATSWVEQRVALPHRDAVRRDDVLEDLAAAGLADVAEDAGQPIRIVLLDAQLALPFRVGQVFPRLRQVVLLHEPGVVRLHEDVEARADPFAVRRGSPARSDRRGTGS